ncbi:MAG: carboxypeptidase regulatory-like domain-containing protein [Candidatus Kapabacteria bacterium]|nr:carboxypeptidase regulatory-like domain-containing protein [Candidatus Kapabacteria bacterium]
MSYFYQKITVLVAIALFALANINTIQAEDLKAPRFEHADGKIFKEVDDTITAIVNLGWVDENTNLEGFGLYVYYGESKDYDDFTLYKKIDLKDESLNHQKHYFQYLIREFVSESKIVSFYITSYAGGHESEGSGIKIVKLKQANQNHNQFLIVGKPAHKAAIGEEYAFEFKIEANVDYTDLEIKLEHSPEGAVLDVENMIVKWTPTKGGNYTFVLYATAKSEEGDLHAKFSWTVEVMHCKVPAIVSGEVVDEDGTLVEFGTAMLFWTDGTNGREGKFHRVYDARIVEGKYEFKGVDAGEYYLQISAYTKHQKAYHPVWYKNATNFMDATPIEIECGETYEFDFVVEPVKEPEFFKVSGKVLDAETLEPIKWSYVKFIGMDSRNHNYNLEVVTNHFGEYSIKLPEAEYIVFAHALKPNSGAMTNQYLPQYYNLANNIQDATILVVNENISGIDFALDRVPTYENSIKGKVVSVDDINLKDVVVSAYCTDPGNQNEKFRFYSKSAVTDENGNFEIENLMPGTYILYANTRDKIYMPGFYVVGKEVSAKWKDATEFEVEEEGAFGPYTLTLPIFEKVHGNGRIKGIVRERTGSIKSGNDELQGAKGLNGANVYIFDMQNNPVKSVNTDEFGNFELNQIPNGKYTIVLDKVGFHPFSYEVDLTTDNNDLSKEVEMSPISTSSVSTIFKIETTVFPNPVSDLLNIQFESAAGVANIKLAAYTGATYLNESLQTIDGQNNISYSIKNIPQGIYFLTIDLNGSIMVTPLVISK